MSKFVATSRNKPCLSCGDISGNCRHQAEGEIILCMSASSGRKGELVNGGYKIIDFSQDGLWAILKPDNSSEWSEERRREWAEEQRRRREQSQREQQQKLAQLLPISQRDQQYRRIIATLELNQKHRVTELSERRGLSQDEINFALTQQWLCSWKPGVKVHASSLLAGVAAGQLTGVVGLGIAALNAEGEITGFQIASDNRAKFGKYIWLSSASKGGNSPHLPNGELPVFVWRHPQADKISETWLVEGGLKSLITVLKLWFRCGRKDIQIVGAAGGNWHGSINAVVEALSQVTKVILCPDAGSLANSHILGNYKKIIEALTSKAYSVSVAWWGQLEKDDSDIDELDNTLGFDLITPGEFLSLADESQLQDDSQDWAWRNWLKSRHYTADIVLNQSKFRFPTIPDSDVVIAAKSGLGSGKTEALLELIRLSPNRGFLIGYINNLLLQTGNRSSQTGTKIYHLREDDGIALVADNGTHLMLCLDSIHHIDGYFKGVDIYLDETVSVLLHAINGGTLKEKQAQAIAILSKALRECNRVILLDGNLADIYVDFIAKIAGKKAIKIGNEAQIAPHNFKFIVGIDEDGEIKKRDKSPLIKALLADDVIPWIASDSKNLTDAIDEIMRQAGKHGYVLNKDTSGEEWAKEFLVNPNAFILKYKPQYFIHSPTAESGVSVTVKNYFTDKFTFFTGVQGTNSQHQMLFRLRDNSIPHYVFCPERSTIRDRNNPKNYSAKAFSKILNEKILQSALLAAEGNTSRMIEIINNAISRSSDEWWGLACHLGALDNFEMNNLRKCLIHVLQEAGHHVEVCEWDTDDQAKAREEAAKEAVRMRYALELYQAIEFSSVDEASKVAKGNPKKEVQRRIEKTWLLDSLPGIKESSVWNTEFIADFYIKDKEFIPKQRRFYFLNNFKISHKRSEVKWYYLATDQHFFLAQAKGDSHRKIWALQQLNILQFLEGEFYKNSPALVKLVNTVRERPDIALALNTAPNAETESKKENIKFLRLLLDSIGIKLAKPSRKLVNGVREYVYCVDKQAMQAPARLAVLEAIGRKFDNYLQSESAAKVNWEEVPVIEASEIVTDEAAAVIVDEPQNLADTSPQSSVNSQQSIVNSQQSTANEQHWLTDKSVQYVAECLHDCDREMLDDLRALYPAKALTLAARRLPQQRRQIIKQWVMSHNTQQSTVNSEPEVDNPVGHRCWVWHYNEWKEAVIQAWEYRPHEKFFKSVVSFIENAVTCNVWQREAVFLQNQQLAIS